MTDLPKHVQELIRQFLEVADELDVLTAPDSDERSIDFWIRTENALHRMGDAAGRVARAMAYDEALHG